MNWMDEAKRIVKVFGVSAFVVTSLFYADLFCEWWVKGIGFDWFVFGLTGVCAILFSPFPALLYLACRDFFPRRGRSIPFGLLLMAFLVQGCATTRTVTVRDTNRTAAVSHGGEDDNEVRLGFWRAMWEPWVEEQSTKVAEESWRRQEGSVYHGKALKAAEATRLTEPFVEAPVAIQPFDQPLAFRQIAVPGAGEEEFSRYEEEPVVGIPLGSFDEEESPVDQSGPVRVRQAMRGGTMELPLTAQEGGHPVVLINDSRRAKQFIIRRERGPQYEVSVAPGQRSVRYLQLGRHYVEVRDQNGRLQKIRDPRREVYKRSWSYSRRDRSWDYTGSFVVNSVPSFIDESGQQFFGVFRSY